MKHYKFNRTKIFNFIFYTIPLTISAFKIQILREIITLRINECALGKIYPFPISNAKIKAQIFRSRLSQGFLASPPGNLKRFAQFRKCFWQ